jgi:tetratricopeptide (TPR) repeat protein
LSVSFGTPNSCTGCHLRDLDLPGQGSGFGVQGSDRSVLKELLTRKDLKEYADWLSVARRGDEVVKARLAAVDRWADATYDKWFGKNRKREPHFAEALAPSREMDSEAPTKLRELLSNRLQPAVARATAALELSAFVEPGNEVVLALRKALMDRDPQVRAAAVTSLQQEGSDATVSALVPLLHDEMRLVRTEAARALALMGHDRLRGDERADFKNALDECLAAIEVDNDRAAGHMSLGILYENLNLIDRAEAAYKTALRIEPGSIGARTNLAALYDRQVQQAQQRAMQLAQSGNREAAEREIATIIDLPEQIGPLREAELALLERDALLAPDNAPIQGRIGLARYLGGWTKEAESALLMASLLEPHNPEHLFRLAVYYRDTQRSAEAAKYVERLLKLRPDSQMFQQFAAELASPTQPVSN